MVWTHAETRRRDIYSKTSIGNGVQGRRKNMGVEEGAGKNIKTVWTRNKTRIRILRNTRNQIGSSEKKKEKCRRKRKNKN